MKRTLLAVTIPVLMATVNTGNAHDLYDKDNKKLELAGNITAKRNFSRNDSDSGDASSLEIGLKGETPFDEKLNLFGTLALSKALNSTPFAAQTLVGGIKSEEMGSLSYGRTMSVMVDVAKLTAILPAFGGDALGGGADKFGTGRATGLLQYRTPKVQGLQLAVQYLGANLLAGDKKETVKTKDNELKKGNGDGYGASLIYDTDQGITIGVGYNNVAKSASQKEHFSNKHKATMVAVGAAYKVDAFHVAATYAQTRNQALFSDKELTSKVGVVKPTGDEKGIYANKTEGFEVVARYKLPSGLQPSIGYMHSTAQIKTDIYDVNVRNVQYIAVGANYEFNDKISAYADYKINLLNKDKAKMIGVSAIPQASVGLTYKL